MDLFMAAGEQHLLKAHPFGREVIRTHCSSDWSRSGDILRSAIEEFVTYYENNLRYWVEHK